MNGEAVDLTAFAFKGGFVKGSTADDRAGQIAQLRARLVEIRSARAAAATAAERHRQEASHDRTALALAGLEQAVATQAVADAILEATWDRLKDGNDRRFWTKRYLTSLLIGNGAFLTLAVTRLQERDGSMTADMAEQAVAALRCFALGLLFAGLLPLALIAWQGLAERPKSANGKGLLGTVQIVAIGLTLLSTIALGFGVWHLAEKDFGVVASEPEGAVLGTEEAG